MTPTVAITGEAACAGMCGRPKSKAPHASPLKRITAPSATRKLSFRVRVVCPTAAIRS